MKKKLLRKTMTCLACAACGAWLSLRLSGEKRERVLKLIHEAGELPYRVRL